jgi:hypothetical protein
MELSQDTVQLQILWNKNINIELHERKAALFSRETIKILREIIHHAHNLLLGALH